MRLFKILLVPAALAIAPAASFAAPALPNANAPDEIRNGIELTPAHYTGYYHPHRYYAPPPRRYWRGYYYAPPRFVGPRCFWSHHYRRTICR